MNTETTIGIIDIETTGFLQQGGKIVEVGIVALDTATGERELIYDKVVCEPETTIKELRMSWIMQNSSLTAGEVANAPSLAMERERIREAIEMFPAGMTAYNNKFDFDFLESRQIQIPVKLACPMKIATNVCRIPNKGRKGFKWPKVTEAMGYFFPEESARYVEAHRGGLDAMDEARIVQELIKREAFTLETV